MYVHDRARLIYLAHPRTASNATVAALAGCGFRQVGVHHGTIYRGREVLNDQSSRRLVTPENRREWFAFTTVRNHWDACVSWVFNGWAGRGGPPELWNIDTFRHALDDNAWVKPDRLWWVHDDADLVLRYETLQEDLDAVLRWTVGIDGIELGVENVTEGRAGRHYSVFYTPETRDFIAERFAGEIERYGYTFEQGVHSQSGELVALEAQR